MSGITNPQCESLQSLVIGEKRSPGKRSHYAYARVSVHVIVAAQGYMELISLFRYLFTEKEMNSSAMFLVLLHTLTKTSDTETA